MTAGLCVCDAATVRAVSPDRCACGGALYRESIAAASAEPPALSQEEAARALSVAQATVAAGYPRGTNHGLVTAWALAERARADRAEAALVAFQRASGCADGVTLAVALRERNDLVRDLRDVAAGVTLHRQWGECPDAERTIGADSRDLGCDACHVLCRADAALVGSHRSDA